jgi:hypothetical protein
MRTDFTDKSLKEKPLKLIRACPANVLHERGTPFIPGNPRT